MMNNQKVSIIILNWNNAPDTITCIESVFSLSYKNFSVIVVDNASEDSSVIDLKRFLAEKKYGDSVTLLENKENTSFSGGNNVGMQYAVNAGADYVLVLNNDTIVAEDLLDKLLDGAGRNDRIGIVGPAIYFEDRKSILWFGGASSISWLRMEHLISNELYNKELSENTGSQEVNFLTGACMLIKSNMISELGGFDERFFLYFEDADLSFRALKRGYKLVWTPHAKIWHKISATTIPQTGGPVMNYYNVRNILLLARKHGPWWVRFFYMHIWAYYKFTKQLIKLVFPQKYDAKFSKTIVKGIGDYYKGNFGKYKK